MTARPAIPQAAHAPLAARIERQWDESILPELIEYIRLPAKSPAFDADWARHGHIDMAIQNAERWVKAQSVKGL